MNTDAINEIRKAAEAVIVTGEAAQSGAESVEDQRMRSWRHFNALGDFKRMADDYLKDPATVLELCRLAEIGHCFVHDRPGDSKIEKMLRLEREYKEAKK